MFFILSFIYATNLWATPAEENLLAVGQGVSSPSVTSLMNTTRGYTPENPSGVMYQGGFRGTVQYAKNGDSDVGGEIGYAGSGWGMAAGFFNNGCDSCESVISASLGFAFGDSVWMGFRYEDESLYGFGFMFNPEGKHRVGLVGEWDEVEGYENDIYNIGLGYAYVSKNNTFSVDYSIQELENPAATNEVKVLSPSYSRRQGKLQVTFGYEILQGSTSDNNDSFWMGAGFRGKGWHLAIYSVYHKETMVTLSGFY